MKTADTFGLLAVVYEQLHITQQLKCKRLVLAIRLQVEERHTCI